MCFIILCGNSGFQTWSHIFFKFGTARFLICFHAALGMVLTQLFALRQIHGGIATPSKAILFLFQLNQMSPLLSLYRYMKLNISDLHFQKHSESGSGDMSFSPPLEYAFHSTYYDILVDPSPELILTKMLMRCQRKRNLDIAHGR